MKRLSGFLPWVALALLVASCAIERPASTEVFVITDGDGKSLTHYEYLAGTDRLAGTTTYNSQHRAVRKTSYEYDSQGNTFRSVTTVPVLDGKETQVRTYATQEDRDADGRLVKVTRTSSDGQKVETFYGYDQTGSLRGVVQKYADGSLDMMDY
jgi:hypothetical protein